MRRAVAQRSIPSWVTRNFKSIALVLLVVWVGAFFVFFAFLHTNGSNRTKNVPLFFDNNIDSIRQQWIDDVTKNNPLHDRIQSDMKPIVEERMRMETELNEQSETEKLFKIAKILNEQTDKPKYQRKIFKDIRLKDLSPYSQPRHIYDVVKTNFKNAKWQPH
eukprot:75521_1